jgi:hypothetical protein
MAADPARAQLLRQRFKSLNPDAGLSLAKTKEPQPPKKQPQPNHPRRTYYSYGIAMADHQVDWIKVPDVTRRRPTVETERRQKGPRPLEVMADLLQPGSIHLAARRESFCARSSAINRSSRSTRSVGMRSPVTA